SPRAGGGAPGCGRRAGHRPPAARRGQARGPADSGGGAPRAAGGGGDARAAGLRLAMVAVLAVTDAGATTGRWGWLGVRVRDLSEQEMSEISTRHGIREGLGAMVVEVLRETPAESSGLRSGDLLVAFRDLPVVDTRSLLRLIASAPVGETVSLTVLRLDERRPRISVRLRAMPEPVAADRVAGEFGFFVREPEPQPEIGGGPPARGAPPSR